jgi:SNF2 family DNA or RNA helicase
MTDAELISPRIKVIIETYKNIQAMAPGNKVVVFSRFLKFLNILENAFHRKFKVRSLRFDGTRDDSQHLDARKSLKARD